MSSVEDMTLQLQQLLTFDPALVTSSSSKNVQDDYIEQLAPIVKSALASNSAEDLVDILETMQRDADHNINEICSGDHNEYLSSLQELGEVEVDATGLKDAVLMVSQKLGKTGNVLVSSKNDLIMAKKTHENVSRAVEAVTACLHVLELTNKIHILLEEKQGKFAALQLLEELRNVHLKEVSEYGFGQLIQKSVPALTKKVLDETKRERAEWVANLHLGSKDVGLKIFAKIKEQRQLWEQESKSMGPEYQAQFKFGSPVELAFRETNNVLANEPQIDLGPLYESMLVHSSLRLVDQFCQDFENDWKLRRNYLVPEFATKLQIEDSLQSVSNVLAGIAGFSILDRTISRALPQLRPAKEVDDIWRSVVEKLEKQISILVDQVRDEEFVRDLKQQLGIFRYSMEAYDFNCAEIEKLIMNLFHGYSSLLVSQFSTLFQAQLQQDTYMPMRIESMKQYQHLEEVCWYNGSTIEDWREGTQFSDRGARRQRSLPITAPFSPIFPYICEQVQVLISKHEDFLEDLQHDPKHVQNTMRNALDAVLCDACKTLMDRLKLQSTAREQIIQMLINLDYFQNACTMLEQDMTHRRGAGEFEGLSKFTLKAKDQFIKTKEAAVTRVIGVLTETIDNFCDLADYNWLEGEESDATRASNNVSQYLVDFDSYFKVLLGSTFLYLPLSTKSLGYFEAAHHLSSRLLELFLEADEVTMPALQKFWVDIQYVEEFVKELAVDVGNQSLTNVLTELQQNVQLLKNDDFQKYSQPEFRSKHYSMVSPDTAQLLYNKLRRPGDPPRESAAPNKQATKSRFRQYLENM